MQLQCKLRKKVFYNGTPKNKQAQDKESEQNTGTRAPINPKKDLRSGISLRRLHTQTSNKKKV